MRTIFIAILFVISPFSAKAETSEIFAIQIGTYKQFAAEAKQSVSRFGVVHVLTYENLSRVTVGEFTSRQKKE